MDPTTSAHIDTATLSSAAPGIDGIPVLVATSGGPAPSMAQPQTISKQPYDLGGSSAPSNNPFDQQTASYPSESNTSSYPTEPKKAPTSSSSSSTSPSSSLSASMPTATGLRQRVNALGTQLDGATNHPAVQNTKVTAQKQISSFRHKLGQYPLMVDLEKRTGVDRVLLVLGGALAYLILIPLNLFGLAFPTTNLLTFVPPVLLSLRVLDKTDSAADEEGTKALLAYFVTFGFVQFAETLVGGVLARRVPQYFTVKLLFLAYLIHPSTNGAMKFHDAVFRPLLARARSVGAVDPATPPTSKPSTSAAASPTVTQLPSGGGSGVGLEINERGEISKPIGSAF